MKKIVAIGLLLTLGACSTSINVSNYGIQYSLEDLSINFDSVQTETLDNIHLINLLAIADVKIESKEWIITGLESSLRYESEVIQNDANYSLVSSRWVDGELIRKEYYLFEKDLYAIDSLLSPTHFKVLDIETESDRVKVVLTFNELFIPLGFPYVVNRFDIGSGFHLLVHESEVVVRIILDNQNRIAYLGKIESLYMNDEWIQKRSEYHLTYGTYSNTPPSEIQTGELISLHQFLYGFAYD